MRQLLRNKVAFIYFSHWTFASRESNGLMEDSASILASTFSHRNWDRSKINGHSLYDIGFITLHDRTWHDMRWHDFALHYITSHYITLHCITLYCIALHCIAMHAPKKCVLNVFITLHCITIRYTSYIHVWLHDQTITYHDILWLWHTKHILS